MYILAYESVVAAYMVECLTLMASGSDLTVSDIHHITVHVKLELTYNITVGTVAY